MRYREWLVFLAAIAFPATPVAGRAESGTSPLGLPYRGHHIVVDGSLADWRGQYLEVELTDPELVAPLSNHVIVRATWDMDALYVAFEVSDAEVFGPPITAQPGELFCGDSVELYVDVDGNAADRMDGRDFQFLVACDGRAAVLQGDTLLSRAGFAVPKRLHETAVFQHVVARTASGFSVEIGIPWPTLGLERPAAGDTLGLDLAFNDWTRPVPRAAAGVDDDVKLGAVRRIVGSDGNAGSGEASIPVRPEEPTTEDGYWAWSWAGRRDFGFPATWTSVRLVGGPGLGERLDRRLGSLRLPVATLAGAGMFTLVAALVIRTRERRRSRALLQRISELEAEVGMEGLADDTEAVPGRTTTAGAEADGVPSDTGQVPVTTELSGKIDRVRRLVRDEETVPGDLTTRAIARIYQHLDEGLTPSDLADGLFVSLRTLQRAVSGSLGCSPSELIMAVRLREAYRMLKVEQRSVKDAALSAGFTSQPHFSRKFKHHFGINPSEVAAGLEASPPPNPRAS